MKKDLRLRVTFWGVRGSTPTPQIENLNYGGNTPCVEIGLPEGEVFIFDGGTGIRNLGEALLKRSEEEKLKLRVFFTHFHWDHIQGVPFFGPLYREQNEVTFHCVENRYRERGWNTNLQETLMLQMASPYFPVGLDFLPARKNFEEIGLTPLKFGKLSIHPFPLNHPGGAFGYRIEREGAVVVYATDLEHGHGELDKVVREYSQDADLLIFDSQFTPEDYKKHQSWGHSTWAEGCNVAREAGAKQLALFHHNPAYNDHKFYNIVQEARRQFENTIGAQEGWSLVL